MYTVNQIENEGFQYLELSSSDKKYSAKICLNQGARLSEFQFEGNSILADFNPSSYKNNYASAILFPFANRIKDGAYSFNNTNYKLHCNEADKNNALHGLVFNQKFNYTNSNLTSNEGSVTLQYKNPKGFEGFPFKFEINLTYILNSDGLALSVLVKNKDTKAFPFTLGWHPYFNSSNLEASSINFKSDKQFVFDKQQIPIGTKFLDFKPPFNLKNKTLDDSYTLENSAIQFSTPTYNLRLTSDAKMSYLQLYTPNKINTIAIEPMTAAADSFNNKIGLQLLSPKNEYSVKWHVAIETLNNNN